MSATSAPSASSSKLFNVHTPEGPPLGININTAFPAGWSPYIKHKSHNIRISVHSDSKPESMSSFSHIVRSPTNNTIGDCNIDPESTLSYSDPG